MPDIWVDVDAAVIVPVNVMPLLDDTDFKSIETAVVYNSAGMALTWNFVTTAGVVTGTAVTPTTSGVYDWSEPVADKGMYAIEIPASGGGSINNDTEGVGWFTGVATGVLPWRGPTIGFRRKALNDLLIAGSTASTNLEDFFDGTGYVGGTAKLTVDVNKVGGTVQTAQDLGKLRECLYVNGAVWMNTGAGAAGTTSYINGTVINPNSSMANSRTIADALLLKIFQVSNGSSITLDQGYANYSFIGERWTLALASRAIGGSHFAGATVSGLSTGTGAEFDDCIIGNATIANDALFTSCGLSGTLTLQAAGIYTFLNCGTATTAGVDAIIDFGALGATTVALRDYHGGVEVRNMAAGDVVTFIGSGRLTIAASCTAGTLYISGNINLVNNGSGQTINDTARWNEDQTVTWNPAWDAEVQSECDDALVAQNLDHLVKIAVDTDFGTTVHDNSVVGHLAAVSDSAAFDRTTQSLGAFEGNALTAADINAEVVDALNVDTYAEPGQEAPGATVSLVKKIGYLYKFLRNKITQDATTLKVYADDASTVDQKATVSDTGTTYTRGEIGTGP